MSKSRCEKVAVRVEAWVKEAERRFAAWRRGEREGIPAEKAFKQIRKDLGW